MRLRNLARLNMIYGAVNAKHQQPSSWNLPPSADTPNCLTAVLVSSSRYGTHLKNTKHVLTAYAIDAGAVGIAVSTSSFVPTSWGTAIEI